MLLDDVTEAYVKVNQLLRQCTPEELQHLKIEDIPAEYRRRPKVNHVLTGDHGVRLVDGVEQVPDLPDPAQCAAS